MATVSTFLGWAAAEEYASTADQSKMLLIAGATRAAEELFNEKLEYLARAIRQEIAEAWNAGQKKSK